MKLRGISFEIPLALTNPSWWSPINRLFPFECNWNLLSLYCAYLKPIP